jgi:uncharacterized protein YndB with AHSA1/START domain
MSDAALKSDTQDIVVEEVFPHAPETVWKVLTSGELMGLWLGMTPVEFEPMKGKPFVLKTTPAGAWDGFIRCQVLEVKQNERLVYTWRSGHEGNVGSWHAPSPCPFRLRAAQERFRVQEHERGLEEGRRQDRHHVGRTLEERNHNGGYSTQSWNQGVVPGCCL